MVAIFTLIYLIGVPAGLAAALASALANFLPRWSLRRRTVVAAVFAGFLPMTIPAAAILMDAGGEESTIALVVLAVISIVMAVVIGLPVALWIGRRKQVNPSESNPAQTFE